MTDIFKEREKALEGQYMEKENMRLVQQLWERIKNVGKTTTGSSLEQQVISSVSTSDKDECLLNDNQARSVAAVRTKSTQSS